MSNSKSSKAEKYKNSTQKKRKKTRLEGSKELQYIKRINAGKQLKNKLLLINTFSFNGVFLCALSEMISCH